MNSFLICSLKSSSSGDVTNALMNCMHATCKRKQIVQVAVEEASEGEKEEKIGQTNDKRVNQSEEKDLFCDVKHAF